MIPTAPVIGSYQSLPAALHDYDPRAPLVAEAVAALIESASPSVTVEHVGSTSVPGCAGKGVVDLILVYRPGQVSEARNCLDGLGFQRQTGRDPWPEERPMRIASVDYDGTTFLLHVHVISASSPEVAELRSFRDRLRRSPKLVVEHVGIKTAILAEGCTDPVDYSIRKGEFIKEALK